MTHSLIVKRVCSRVKKKKRRKRERTIYNFDPILATCQNIPKLPSTDLSNHDTFISSLWNFIEHCYSWLEKQYKLFYCVASRMQFFFISTSISLFQKIYKKNCKSLQSNNRYIFEFTTLIFLILVMILKYRIILSKYY